MYIPSPFPVFCVVETRIGELSASQMPHNHVGLNLYYLKITLCTWVRAPQFAFHFFCFLLCFVCFFPRSISVAQGEYILLHRRHCHVSIISCPVATATYYFSSPHWLLLTAYCSCISIYPIIPCTCTGGQNDPCETSQESYPSGDAEVGS